MYYINCTHLYGLDLCRVNNGVCLRSIFFTFPCQYQIPKEEVDAFIKYYRKALDKQK